MSTDDCDAPGDSRPLPPRLDPRAGRPARGRSGSTGATATATSATGGRRLVWTGRAVAMLLSLAVLVTSGWGWYLGRVADATVNRTDAIPASGNDETVETGEAMNLLLVGNDSRSALTEEQLTELNAGTDSGTNTDTMILVHVPADGSKASFVSFPRDSYVEIPGHGWTPARAVPPAGPGALPRHPAPAGAGHAPPSPPGSSPAWSPWSCSAPAAGVGTWAAWPRPRSTAPTPSRRRATRTPATSARR